MDTNQNEEHNEMLSAGPGIKSISIHNTLPAVIEVNVIPGKIPPGRPILLGQNQWKTFEPATIPNLKPGMLWAPIARAGREIRGASYPYNPNGVDIYFNVKQKNPLERFDFVLEQTSERPN
ncbi:hypothetical protein C8N46_102403 [Kordia periserrulae]|uniref:Uncharacterized protein n=1 Tax=Kordia periserrulae TaxID=701523 RepID=A0A2T6C3W8_9FLAO|nr:hypothetical protein [Kordia periserrulae]PTX63002.1 hypothetical protein C8N46_102403 [Kordia periserrulae]